MSHTRTETLPLDSPEPKASRDDIRRWQQNLKGEWDASALYRTIADAEKDPVKANVFRKLADIEDSHAARWEGFLLAAGAPLPSHGSSMRAQVLGFLARRFGVKS